MNEDYTAKIQEYLRAHGFKDNELIDDLTDHLLIEVDCLIESKGVDFNNAFEEAKTKILPDNPYELERDLKLLTTHKHNIMIKKIAYIGGYVSALSLAIALLFGILSYQERIDSNAHRILVDNQNLSELLIGEKYEAEWKDYLSNQEISELNVLRKSKLSQSFLILALLLFSITYLPYRFYNGYQNSHMEMT